MQRKTLPLLAAVLLLGSAGIASAQQTNAPEARQPQMSDEQLLVNPGRQQQPTRSGSLRQRQVPSGTTGWSAPEQGAMDHGTTGFQNEPDHSISAVENN
jgi:hypothetical protein